MGTQVIKIFAAKDDEVSWFVAGWDNELLLTSSFDHFPLLLCVSSTLAWRCPHSSRRWISWTWWPLCAMRTTGAATRKSEQLSRASSNTTKWDFFPLTPQFFFFTLCVLWDAADARFSCLSSSIVPQVCSAAIHGRPQTLHVSFFGQQQKVHAIRYLRLVSLWLQQFGSKTGPICKIARHKYSYKQLTHWVTGL